MAGLREVELAPAALRLGDTILVGNDWLPFHVVTQSSIDVTFNRWVVQAGGKSIIAYGDSRFTVRRTWAP